MTDSKELQAILDRIAAGKQLNQKELQILVAAVRSQQVDLATGDRAVAIGGSADGAVIVTGDRNIVLTVTNTDAIRQSLYTRPHSEQLLLEYIGNEVTSRLEKSLHNAVLIRLGMETQTEKIQHPWTSEIKVEGRPNQPIPTSWDNLKIFDEMQGRLLILGKPGAGKTTTMIELTQGLLTRAGNNAEEPIPVLLALSSWEINQISIQEWLVTELQSKYGVKLRFGRELLANRRLILMLDGLDELKSIYQMDCINSINRFLESDERPQYIVVSSRSEEYDINQTKFKLNTAICIKDLNDQQIEKYLTDINCQDLWAILHRDLDLLRLIRQPFWLSIVVLASDGLSREYWNRTFSGEDRFTDLLNSYFKQMTARKAGILEAKEQKNSNRKKINEEFIKVWLSYLAKRMSIDSKVEFLIEDIHPGWLISDSQKALYRTTSVVIFFAISFIILNLSSLLLLVVLILTLHNERTSILLIEAASFLCSIILSAFYYTRVSFYRKFAPVETIAWSGELAFMSFRIEINKVLEQYVDHINRVAFKREYGNYYYYKRNILSFVGLIIKSMTRKILHLLYFLFLMFSGLFSGLYEMLKVGIISGADLEEKLVPNQGITKSRENYITVISIWTLAFVVMLGLLGVILPPPIQNFQKYTVPLGFFIGSFFGIYMGVERGGKAYIQHVAIRIILWMSGKAPENYAVFLDYCTDCLLLQRVGGRYRFIHRLLQEHFANMQLEQPQR